MVRTAKTLRLDPEYYQKRHLSDAELVRMASHRFATFKDLAITVDASAFYPAIEEFYGQGDLPFLRVADVDGFVDTDQCETVPTNLCSRYPTLARVEPRDIVFTKGGAIDRVGLITRCAAASRDLILLRTSTLDEDWSKFLFAYFSSKFFKGALLRSSSQTAQPHLTITLVRELPILRAAPAFRRIVAQTVERALMAKAEVRNYLLRAEECLSLALGLADWSPPERLAYSTSAAVVRSAGRLDAQYFMPAKAKVIKSLEELPGSTIGGVFDSVREVVDPAARESSGPVRNFDVTDALDGVLADEKQPEDFADVGSAKKRMRRGDVVISRLRAYLKEIAIVDCSNGLPAVGSSEFIVLRPRMTTALSRPRP